MRCAASGRRSGLGALLALLVVASGACDRGGSPPPAEKPAEAKDSAAANGFEVSWFGHLSKTYEGGLASAVDVAKAALRRLAIDVQEEKPGIFETTLEAESRDGTSLVVILKEVERGKTRITIKVGYLLGDRDAAQRIHSEIQNEIDLRKNHPGLGGGGSVTSPRPPGEPTP